MINDNLQNRKNVIIGLMIAVVVIFILRLFGMQVLTSSYKDFADSNAFLKKTIYPSRGLIYDRHGKLLVFNKQAYDVMMVMKEVEPFDTLEFCQIVGVEKDVLVKRINTIKNRNLNPGYSPYTPQLLISQLSVEQYAVLQEKLFKFPGFYIQGRTLREYSYPCAAHALGSVGEVSSSDIENNDYYRKGDYIGKNGVEKSYEDYLRGDKGMEILLRDARGRIKGRYEEGALDKTPVSGKSLTLSIDIDLQQYGELLMQNKIGSIVAIEPSTGEILAMVSSPTFNPSDLVGRSRSKNFVKLMRDPLKPLLDRPLMARYPPGSTFKLTNALILQQEGIITPNTRYPCHEGYTVGRFHLGCHQHTSPLNMYEAIEQSCNAYFCAGFRDMLDNNKYGSVPKAFDIWKNHIVSFGFGYKLGVDFPNENRGYIPNISVYNKMYGKGGWRSLTIVSISIGQGEVLSTPMQTANAGAIIANRGYWIRPHVVRKIQGLPIDTAYTNKRYVKIDRKYFDPVIHGMEMAVTDGTARIAQIDGIIVCAKTGTAQNTHGKDHSIFLAFAPKDKPRIAIAVFVENAGFGAAVAAPIASLMMEKYLKGSIDSTRIDLQNRMSNENFLPGVKAN